MNGDLVDTIKFFGGALLCIVGFLATVLFIANEGSRYQCKQYAQITGKETRMSEFDSCYVKTATGWQRWDEYKARAIASEGLKK